MDLATTSLAEIIAARREGRLRSAELADWAIAKHADRGEAFHAYKTWDEVLLRKQAAAADAVHDAGVDLGALQGIPVSVKDLIGVGGYPTFAGCPSELPEEWRREGPVVSAIRRQMGVISGKTHTVQFAFGGLGVNPHWGAPRNPWGDGEHRSPGGSSSGAGVSLHEGSALLAIGTDTAGSVRMPASITGTAGLRPAWGRWSTDGVVPLASGLDTPGPLARTVADLAIGFAAIDPLVSEDPVAYLGRLSQASLEDFNIGVLDWFFEGCDPGIAETAQAAVEELGRAGLRLSSADLPHLDDATEIFSRGGLHVGEMAQFMSDEMADYRADLDPNVAIRLAVAESYTAAEHRRRIKAFDRMGKAANASFRGFHAVIGPTTPATPPLISDVENDPEHHLAVNLHMCRNTNVPSLLHLAGLTLPVGLDAAGMPVGLQICTPAGHEETAIAIALAFERALGTARDRLGVPPMCR